MKTILRTAVLLLSLFVPTARADMITEVLGGGTGRCETGGNAAATAISYPWHLSKPPVDVLIGDNGMSGEKGGFVTSLSAAGTVKTFAASPLSKVIGVAGTSTQTFYTNANKQVMERSAAGTITQRSSAGLVSPQGLCTDATFLYICDSNESNSNLSQLARQPLGCPSCVPEVVVAPGTIPRIWGCAIRNGTLYLASLNANRIYARDPSGAITVVAGTGVGGFSGDGGLATAAQLFLPTDVAVDGAGDLFIPDSQNGRIRFVSAATGIISTIAGNGTISTGMPPMPGQDPTAFGITRPYGVAVDQSGSTVWIGSVFAGRVWMLLRSGGSPTATATSPVATASATRTIVPTATAVATSTATQLPCIPTATVAPTGTPQGTCRPS